MNYISANIHGMISIWPVFAKGTQNFDELSKAGGMTSVTWDNFTTHTFDNYYDAHDSTARDIYWREAKDSLIARYGWDGWWVDQCEPDNGDLLDARRQASFSIGKGIDYFNTYSLDAHHRPIQELEKRHPRETRFLSRAAGLCGSAAELGNVMVVRYHVHFSFIQRSGDPGNQCVCIGHPLLDIGYRRLSSALDVARLVGACQQRIVYAMVSVRDFLPGLPDPWQRRKGIVLE